MGRNSFHKKTLEGGNQEVEGGVYRRRGARRTVRGDGSFLVTMEGKRKLAQPSRTETSWRLVRCTKRKTVEEGGEGRAGTGFGRDLPRRWLLKQSVAARYKNGEGVRGRPKGSPEPKKRPGEKITPGEKSEAREEEEPKQGIITKSS